MLLQQLHGWGEFLGWLSFFLFLVEGFPSWIHRMHVARGSGGSSPPRGETKLLRVPPRMPCVPLGTALAVEGVGATSGCQTYSQAEATVVTLVILVESSDQGWRFWRAKREELWTQMGSAWMGWLMVFWKASCCNCMRMRFACCRSASRSSAVCLLGEREPLGGPGKQRKGVSREVKLCWVLMMWEGRGRKRGCLAMARSHIPYTNSQ